MGTREIDITVDAGADADSAAGAPLAKLPFPPKLRRIFGISSRLSMQAFFLALKSKGVGMLIDIRSQSVVTPPDAWHLPKNLVYLCTEVFGIRYECVPDLMPLPEWWRDFEQKFLLPDPAGRDRAAWSEYLAKYLEALKERDVLGEKGVLRQLLQSPCESVAFLATSLHPADCHRGALIGFLRTHVEGLIPDELSENRLGYGAPPAREIPIRYRVTALPDAGLTCDLPSAMRVEGITQGVILSSHEDADGRFHLDAAVDMGGTYRFMHLRIPNNEAIHPNWVGVSQREMRRYAAPGCKISFSINAQKLGSARWPSHPEQVLVSPTPITLHRDTVSREELSEIMSHAMTMTMKRAFPTLEREPNHHAFVDATYASDCSAACVRCRVTVDVRDGKAFVFDGYTTVRGALLDRELLEAFQSGLYPNGHTFKDVLVRLVLLPPSPSAEAPESRCYLAIGYVQR